MRALKELFQVAIHLHRRQRIDDGPSARLSFNAPGLPGAFLCLGRYRTADQTLREPLEPDRMYALG